MRTGGHLAAPPSVSYLDKRTTIPTRSVWSATRPSGAVDRARRVLRQTSLPPPSSDAPPPPSSKPPPLLRSASVATGVGEARRFPNAGGDAPRRPPLLSRSFSAMDRISEEPPPPPAPHRAPDERDEKVDEARPRVRRCSTRWSLIRSGMARRKVSVTAEPPPAPPAPPVYDFSCSKTRQLYFDEADGCSHAVAPAVATTTVVVTMPIARPAPVPLAPALRIPRIGTADSHTNKIVRDAVQTLSAAKSEVAFDAMNAERTTSVREPVSPRSNGKTPPGTDAPVVARVCPEEDALKPAGTDGRRAERRAWPMTRHEAQERRLREEQAALARRISRFLTTLEGGTDDGDIGGAENCPPAQANADARGLHFTPFTNDGEHRAAHDAGVKTAETDPNRHVPGAPRKWGPATDDTANGIDEQRRLSQTDPDRRAATASGSAHHNWGSAQRGVPSHAAERSRQHSVINKLRRLVKSRLATQTTSEQLEYERLKAKAVTADGVAGGAQT